MTDDVEQEIRAALGYANESPKDTKWTWLLVGALSVLALTVSFGACYGYLP